MNKDEIIEKEIARIRNYESEINADESISEKDREIFSYQINNGLAEARGGSASRRAKREVNPSSKLFIVLDGYKNYWEYADGIYESENTIYHQAKNDKNLLVKDWPVQAKEVIARLLHMTTTQLNEVADKVFIADDIRPLSEDENKIGSTYNDFNTTPWYVFAGTRIETITGLRRPFYKAVTGSAELLMRNVFYYFLKGMVSGVSIHTLYGEFFAHKGIITHNQKKIKLDEQTKTHLLLALTVNSDASDDTIIYTGTEGRIAVDSDMYTFGGLTASDRTVINLSKLDILDMLKQVNTAHSERILLWKSLLDNMGTFSIDEIIIEMNKLDIYFDYTGLIMNYRNKWRRDMYTILSGELVDETAELKYELSSRGIPEKFPIT